MAKRKAHNRINVNPGDRYGRLTVIEEAGFNVSKSGKSKERMLKCKCECGNESIVRFGHLRSGATSSCGCFKKEVMKTAMTTHGLKRHKFYGRWSDIKKRCYKENHIQFHHYGGRGIGMWEGWLNDVAAFITYIESLPNSDKKGYTLDRIDNDGNYEPGNLRWATPRQQNRNQRSNIVVDFAGKKLVLSALSEQIGLPYSMLKARYRRGDRGDRLVRPSGTRALKYKNY